MSDNGAEKIIGPKTDASSCDEPGAGTYLDFKNECDYKTIKAESSVECTTKRSRFIVHVRPVETKEQAESFIEQVRTKHWDASHNVYAYVLREGTRRYTDDGEPQGTAGMPVLDVLVKEDLYDCAVVVTRYFGGVMLGSGGLVRAYSHSAKEALKASDIITMSLCINAKLRCDYNFYGKLPSVIKKYNGSVGQAIFSDEVDIDFYIPDKTYILFEKSIAELSCGKYRAEVLRKVYMEL
jgi:uncharacterized YigZ family protein